MSIGWTRSKNLDAAIADINGRGNSGKPQGGSGGGNGFGGGGFGPGGPDSNGQHLVLPVAATAVGPGTFVGVPAEPLEETKKAGGSKDQGKTDESERSRDGLDKKKVSEGNDKQTDAKKRLEIEKRLGKFSSELDRPTKPAVGALPTLEIPKGESPKATGDKKESETVEVAQAKKDPAAVPSPPPAAEPSLATQHRKIIIRSGEMEFEIDSFDVSVATIFRLISTVKDGFVATVNSEKLANGKMRGSVVVRMPPERLDDFVLELRKALAKVGELKGQRIGSQDITEKYTDLESELKAHRTMENRLLGISARTGKER